MEELTLNYLEKVASRRNEELRIDRKPAMPGETQMQTKVWFTK